MQRLDHLLARPVGVGPIETDARGAALRELPPLTLEELRERLEGPDGAAEPLSATGAPEAPPDPTPLLKAGDTYNESIEYRFGIVEQQ